MDSGWLPFKKEKLPSGFFFPSICPIELWKKICKDDLGANKWFSDLNRTRERPLFSTYENPWGSHSNKNILFPLDLNQINLHKLGRKPCFFGKSPKYIREIQNLIISFFLFSHILEYNFFTLLDLGLNILFDLFDVKIIKRRAYPALPSSETSLSLWFCSKIFSYLYGFSELL